MDWMIKQHVKLTPMPGVLIGFSTLMELQMDIIVKTIHNVTRTLLAKMETVATLQMVTMTLFVMEKLELHVSYLILTMHAINILSINENNGGE